MAELSKNEVLFEEPNLVSVSKILGLGGAWGRNDRRGGFGGKPECFKWNNQVLITQ
jgi:hypothetical protein